MEEFEEKWYDWVCSDGSGVDHCIEDIKTWLKPKIQSAVKDALESTRLDRKTQEILDMLPKFSDDETVEMVETKILECVFEAQQKLITKAIKSYEKD